MATVQRLCVYSCCRSSSSSSSAHIQSHAKLSIFTDPSERENETVLLSGGQQRVSQSVASSSSSLVCPRVRWAYLPLSVSSITAAAPSHEYNTHQQKQKHQPLPTQNETLMLHLPVFCPPPSPPNPIDWVYAQIHLGTVSPSRSSRSSSASNIIR